MAHDSRRRPPGCRTPGPTSRASDPRGPRLDHAHPQHPSYQTEPSLQWHSVIERFVEARHRSLDALLEPRAGSRPSSHGARLAREREHTDLSRQLLLAERLQRSILPEQMAWPGLDVFSHLEAASYVGGDFYDVHPLPGRRYGLVVGDVSGQGIPAALLMMLTVGVMREVCRHAGDPREILTLVNRRICACLPDDQYEAYVTASYCMVDLEAMRISFSSAGHAPPLLRRGRDGAVIPLVAQGFFLGYFEDAEYQLGYADLAPGDQVILCTDGILESRNARGDFFDSEMLEELVRARSPLGCQDLGRCILDEVATFREDPSPRDDVALLIAEVTTG